MIILASLGCSDAVGVAPCSSDIAVTITGAEPRVEWHPPCLVNEFAIYEAGNVIWAMRDADGLRSPVTYGLVPEGAETVVEPAVLEPGVEYGVVLSVWDSAGVRVLGPFPFTVE